MSDWLADPKRPKVVHDPKLFQILTAPNSVPGSKTAGSRFPAHCGIRHAVMLYSYLLRPTTANHAFGEVVLRHLNQTLSGAGGERADLLLRLAPILRAEVEKALQARGLSPVVAQIGRRFERGLELFRAIPG